MMTFSIVWVVLATTVTVVALMRRSCLPTPNMQENHIEVQPRQPGTVLTRAKILTVVGVVYSLVLLAGFLYIGWQNSLEFMK